VSVDKKTKKPNPSISLRASKTKKQAPLSNSLQLESGALLSHISVLNEFKYKNTFNPTLMKLVVGLTNKFSYAII